MDSRGNWSTFAKEIGVSPVIKWQSRTHNGANEIQVIDPDVQNGLTTDQVAVSVDANGNLTTDPLAPNVGTAPAGQKYVYDAANRVIEIWRTNVASNPSDDELLLEIEYDVLGRRVQTKEWIDPTDGAALTTPNTTWHVYAGLNVVEEYGVTDPGITSATTDLHRQFIWGQGFPAPVAMIDRTDAGDVLAASGEEVLHYLRDILGSVVALTNTNGEVVERYEYDPYGHTYISDVDTNGNHVDASYRTYSRFGNSWMWTGQRHDDVSGTFHFATRSYSPTLGRWMQRDPMGYVDGLNLREIVKGSPLRFVDPLGLQSAAGQVPTDAVVEVDEVTGTIESKTKGSSTGIKNGERGYWRVDIENQKESGNVHVHWENEKYYYDPVNDTFRTHDGNIVSNSVDKKLRKTTNLMDSVRKGVDEITETKQRNFHVGNKKFVRASALASLLFGFMIDSALAVDNHNFQKEYKNLLYWVARGDLDAADKVAREMGMILIEEGHDKPGVSWLILWDKIILPKLYEESRKICEQRRGS
jgi:RHS repeat-associated protein